MEYNFKSRTHEDIRIRLLADNDLQIIFFLGGKWGRFVSDRLLELVGSITIALYVTTIWLQFYLPNTYETVIFDRYLWLYAAANLAVDYLLFFRIYPKTFWSFGYPFFTIFNKWARDKSVKVYNISNKQHDTENAVFLQFDMPPQLVMGIRGTDISFTILDHKYDGLGIRGGNLNEDDIHTMMRLIAEHLGLSRKDFETDDQSSDLDYINEGLYWEDGSKREGLADKFGYDLNSQRSRRIRPIRSPLATLLCLIIIFYVALSCVLFYYSVSDVFLKTVAMFFASWSTIASFLVIMSSESLFPKGSQYEST